MKAKACTRCRQWKVRCDASKDGTEGCTRCQESKVRCLFDRGFRRQSRNRKIADMQAEIDQLKELVASTTPEQSPAMTAAFFDVDAPNGFTTRPTLEASEISAPAIDRNTTKATVTDIQHGCAQDKSIGALHLSISHVDDLFRIYFARCHPYLPFNLEQSVEVIFERSPLLFWVICAVASADNAKASFEGPVRSLIADTLDPSKHNLEMVQALLIVCMWPFPFIGQHLDSSFVYSGIATQISLSLGLHRPAVENAGYGPDLDENSRHNEEMRISTWLACCVIAQIQTSRRGIPATISTECIPCFEQDGSAMSNLYHISRLTLEANHTIGAFHKDAGLIEPSARMSLIIAFGRQFDDLNQRQRRQQPSEHEKLSQKGYEIIEIFFLSATLQLWSFALHADMPKTSSQMMRVLTRASEDAVRLIQILCEKNLSLVPFYIRKSLFYAALFLYRLKLTHTWTDGSLIDHHIESAKQALSSTNNPNFGNYLGFITRPDHVETFHAAFTTPHSPYRARLAAFMSFDCMKAYIDAQLADMLGVSASLHDLQDLSWTE